MVNSATARCRHSTRPLRRRANSRIEPVRPAAELQKLVARGLNIRRLLIEHARAFHHLIRADDEEIRLVRADRFRLGRGKRQGKPARIYPAFAAHQIGLKRPFIDRGGTLDKSHCRTAQDRPRGRNSRRRE